MTTSEPTAEQLVRAIRREEENAADQRSQSAQRRTSLLRQLADATGSKSEAARRLGVSPQAVSKALGGDADTEDEKPLEELGDRYANLPSLNYVGIHLGKWHSPGYGAGVLSVEEWRRIEDTDERREAAREAAVAWAARYHALTTLERLCAFFADGCDEVLEGSEEATATSRQVREIILEDWEQLVQYLPATREQARNMGAFARDLREGLNGCGLGQRQFERWEGRAEDPEADARWRAEVEAFGRDVAARKEDEG